MRILGKLVEELFQVNLYVTLLFFQRGQDTHEDASSIGPCIRDRAETDLSGNDCGSEVSLGEIVFSWDLPVVHPMIQTRGVIQKEILDAPDSQMHGWGLDGGEDLGFDVGCFSIEFGIGD